MDELDEKVIHIKTKKLAEINQGFKKKQKKQPHLRFPNKLFFKNVALVASRCNSPGLEGPVGCEGRMFFCVCVRVRVCASVAAADYKFANEKNVAVQSEARARPSERAAERPTLPVQPAAAICKNISRPELPCLPCLWPRYAARTQQIAFSFFFLPPSFCDNTETFGLELLYVWVFFPFSIT